MRVSLIGIALVLLPGCSEERAGIVQSQSKDHFDELLKKHPVVLVDFQADWCGPCRRMKPVIRELERDYRGRLLVIEVDIDQQPELANRYSIRSIPRFLVFRDGKVVDSLTGVVDREDLDAGIERALGR